MGSRKFKKVFVVYSMVKSNFACHVNDQKVQSLNVSSMVVVVVKSKNFVVICLRFSSSPPSLKVNLFSFPIFFIQVGLAQVFIPSSFSGYIQSSVTTSSFHLQSSQIDLPLFYFTPPISMVSKMKWSCCEIKNYSRVYSRSRTW